MRWGLVGLVVLAGCAERALVGLAGDARVEPAELEASTWVGFPVERTVFVTQASRAAATVEVSASPGLTLLGGSVIEVAGGATAQIKIRVEAKAAGAMAASVRLTIDGVARMVPVTGEIQAVPACPAPAACGAARFDPVTAGCVVEPLPDGSACGSACLENGSCVAGTCVGTATSCDDGNACTADACGADGCAHAAVACAASTDPCKVASCDPQRGCVLDDVADGTACGTNDCTTAYVCMVGVCQVVAAPEGSICAPSTPCAAEGRCARNLCVAAPKKAASRWQIADTATAKHALLGVVSPAGLVYGTVRDPLLETPALRIVAWDANGFERWRSPPYTAFGSTTALYDAERGNLVIASKTWARALDGATGAQRWFVDLDAQIPLGDGGAAGVKSVYPLKLTLLPQAKRVVIAYSEGGGSHVIWVFGLDTATGAQAFKFRRDGHLYGLMTTDGDRLFVGSAGCWQPASWNAVYDASGAQAWNVFQTGMPAISSGSQVWFQPTTGMKYVGRIDLTTGSMAQEMANGNDTAVLANGSLLYLRSAGAFTAWDVGTHQEKWSAPGFPSQQTFLTEGGGVLGVSSTEVAHLDATGAVEWRCAIAATGVNTSSASLSSGNLLTQTSTGIGAFPLGTLKVSATGWSVSDRGSPERTFRAR